MLLAEFVFVTVLIAALVVSFRHPKIAALVVVSLSIGSFHKYFPGPTSDFSWIIVFLAPLALWVLRNPLDHAKDVIRANRIVWIFFCFTLISTALALDFSVSWVRMWELAKLLICLTIVFTVMQNRMDIQALAITMALSIAVYGCFVGPYQMLDTNEPIVGPEDSILGDRNNVAAALVTSVPVLYWLARIQQRRWARVALYLIALVSCVSVLGTYSRGGFLALTVMLFLLSTMFRAKWIAVTFGLLVAGTVFVLMPENFIERIQTIREYKGDESAMARISAWKNTVAVAIDRPFGGGYEYQKNVENFARYTKGVPHAAHSIYFQALGDHGFFGLVLFLFMLGQTVLIAAGMVVGSRHSQDAKLQFFAFSLLTSLCSFLVAGAFLSLAYWDGLFFLMFAIRALAMAKSQSYARPSNEIVRGRSL